MTQPDELERQLADDLADRGHGFADEERLRRLGGVPTGTDEGGAA